jgi:hypothetical protein
MQTFLEMQMCWLRLGKRPVEVPCTFHDDGDLALVELVFRNKTSQVAFYF